MGSRTSEEIVADLRKHAEIRKQIRKEGDRLAAKLEEAADRIEELEKEIEFYFNENCGCIRGRI